ncbi:MAG: glycosyltransferase family A protein [Actinomycetota bacterium]
MTAALPTPASWPSVSVVVPTRQRMELLRRALISIAGQRYAGSIEIVVVFDQEEPVDPGVEMGERRSIRLMSNERIAGLAGARNTGILAATGDFIAYCDDDDEWLPDKLRRQIEAALTPPLPEVVVTGATIMYEDRTIDRVPEHDVDLSQLLRSRVQEIHPSSILVERAAMQAIGVVDEAMPGSYGEDYEWLLRAARRAPIRVVPAPLVKVYWHRSSFFADRWAVIVESIQYLLDKHPEFAEEPKGLARLYGRLAFANAAMGNRSEARRWAGKTLRLSLRERRAYLALGVSWGLVSSDRLMRLAHQRGKGV